MTKIQHFEVCIVGAGAAGMFAAIAASKKYDSIAKSKSSILVLEKNRKPGVKILMSGGTRCNITHATDEVGIANAFGNQGRFLRSALNSLTPQKIIEWIEERGVKTKREDTGKIFPVSNKAIDVRDAIWNEVAGHCTCRTGVAVTSIEKTDDFFLVTTEDTIYQCQTLIIASGGQSYPGCGTTGDGYAWARQFGHTIVKPVPSLTPIKSLESWVHELSGVTCERVCISIHGEKKKSSHHQTTLDVRRQKAMSQNPDSLLFTHFGFSGPAALNPSRFVAYSDQQNELEMQIDFLPNRNGEQLSSDLIELKSKAGQKELRSILHGELQRRLLEKLIQKTGLSSNATLSDLSHKSLRRIVTELKQCRIPINGTLGFKKAEVTAGGVSLKEIDSKTMQSKLVPNLYFAGEILDVDGPIGGFNFQAAFSTGWVAGLNH